MMSVRRKIGAAAFAFVLGALSGVREAAAQPVGAQQAWAQVPGSADVIKNAPDSNKLLAIDTGGNAIVASQIAMGTDNSAIKIWRYPSDGSPPTSVVWWDLAEGTYYPAAIALDSSQNIIVTGTARGPDGADFITLKYTNGLTLLWAVRYNNSPQDSDDIAVALAINLSSGDVYVTGSSVGTNTSTDYATVKYNASGVQQWVRRYEYPKTDVPSEIVLVQTVSGPIIVVTGTSWNGTNDYATIAYTASGGFHWATLFSTGYAARFDGGGEDYATSIATLLDRVYVTGGSTRAGTSLDYCTICYMAADGSAGWASGPSYYCGPSGCGPGGSPQYTKDVARKVVATKSLNMGALEAVYVTGESWGTSATGYAYATLQYNALTGDEGWPTPARLDSSVFQGDDLAVDMTVQEEGPVYVTGISFNGATRDYRSIRYNGATGAPMWLNPMQSIAYDGGLSDEASSIRLIPVPGAYYHEFWILGRSTTASGIQPALVKYCQCAAIPCACP